MKKFSRTRIVIALALLAGALAPVRCDADPHRFEIEPYLWGHSISGRFGAGDLPPVDVALSGNEVITGFSGRGAYLHPSGWGVRVSGYQSSTERSGTTDIPEFPRGLIDASMGRFLIAPQYELPLESKTSARIWLGAQLSMFSLEARLTRADSSYVSASDSRNWWDPVIGTDIRRMLSESWFVNGSAGWGGFGVNSRMTLSLMGAVGYQFDPLFSIKLGYLYEGNDYAKDGLLLDGSRQGFLVGLQFNI